MRQGWTGRLVAVGIPEIDIRTKTGILVRAGAYLSPLALRAIELIEQGVAAMVDPKVPRSTRARPVLVR